MTTETILIRVREDGSRVVRRNLEEVGSSADKAAGFVGSLGGVLAALASAGVITGLVRMADTFTTMQNKLRLVTTSTENLNTVTKELLSISNQTRSDFEATTELYARVASATKEMGLSQKETLGFTKSLNQAVVLSGASASEAAGGIRQLSQGLASGTLRGDELNSVLENFPKVADVIAESMGISRGELRKLGGEGKITAGIIIDAFAQAADELEADFATTVPTVGQAFTVLKNNLLAFVGEADKALDITRRIAEFVLVIGNNLNVIIPVLVGIATGIATAFAPAVISIFTAKVAGLFALMAANPIGAVVVAVVAVTTALFAMRDQLKLGSDSAATLGDLLRAAWEGIGPAIAAAAELAGKFFKWLSDTSGGTFAGMIDDINGYQNASESMWFKLVRTTAKIFDMIGGVVRGTFQGLQAIASKVIDTIIKGFSLMGQSIEAALAFDTDSLRAISTEGNALLIEAGSNLGTVFGAAFAEAQLSQADNGLEALLDKLKSRAAEIAKAREGADGGFAPGTPPGAPPTVVDPKAAKELDRLRDALRGLQDAADPVGATMRRLNEAQATLAASVAAGLIPLAEADRIYDSLYESVRAQLDPLGALNEELDRNIQWLKMGSAQRQIDIDLYQMVARLQQDGVRLTREETDALRAKLVVEAELARIAQARDSIQANSGGAQLEEFKANVEAMRQLLANQSSGFGAGDVAAQLQTMMPWANLEGTREQMAGYVQLHADMYEQIRALQSENIISQQTADYLRFQADQQLLDMKLANQRKFFSALSSLSTSENRKLAAIGKAAALTGAIIDGFRATQAALAAPPGWPYNAPSVIAVGAQSAANIAGIASAGFRTGGSMTVGGSGGPDSQTVAFRATPGEKINVNTPAQARAAEQGSGNGPISMPVTIINPPNQEAYLAAMSGAEGEQIIMNTLEKYPQKVRAIAGAG